MAPETRNQATLEADPNTNDMKVQPGEKRKTPPTEHEEQEPQAKVAKTEDEDTRMADHSDGEKVNGKSNGINGANGVSKEQHKEDKEDEKEGKEESNKKSSAKTNGTTSDAPSNVATDYSDEDTVLEKGILYFFFRPRVDFDEPSKLSEVQRGYIVLRPLSKDQELPDGNLDEAKNLRLLAIPKKALPHKGGRLLSFTESEPSTAKELKESFLKEVRNETKTMGTRVTGAPVPVAEGVYALIHTNKTTHFVYMTTVPDDIGEVQKNFGITEQGSFVVSVRNPSFESPPYARLPESAKYPQELIDEFQTLRWLPLHPKFLDYAHCEVLFIGEKQDALPTDDKNKGDEEMEQAEEELKHLEADDESRVQHLDKEHKVFQELKLSKEQAGKMPTEW